MSSVSKGVGAKPMMDFFTAHAASPKKEPTAKRPLEFEIKPAKKPKTIYESIEVVVKEAAERVLTCIGPGQSESTYQKCLAIELRYQGYDVIEKSAQTIMYRDVNIGYTELDILIKLQGQKFVVLELKSVDSIPAKNVHQVKRYMRNDPNIIAGFLV